MAQVAQFGNLMVRISTKNSMQLEVSHNNGITWSVRFFGQPTIGAIYDIEVRGKDLIAFAEKGTFRSSNVSAFVRL